MIDEPIIPANVSLPEITLRVISIRGDFNCRFSSSECFLGLKVGATVSASIPAAVISMGILRFFSNSNILENNMVQIMASVGEALTAGIAFILPALIILHVWDKFNYWQTVITGLLGGGLGVLFTIPLRRALLQDKTLRYPEAVAIGNVLKASTTSEKGDLRSLVVGGWWVALIALFQSGFQILTDNFNFGLKHQRWFWFWFRFIASVDCGRLYRRDQCCTQFISRYFHWLDCWRSYSLLGIMACQMQKPPIKWRWLIWRDHIRYMGVGTMLVGGLWTLCTLFKPVINSMATSFTSLA